MREPFTLTRRGFAAAVPLAVGAASPPAIARNAHPDAELLALRPVWLDVHTAYDATFEPVALAERLVSAREKLEPQQDQAIIERETGYLEAAENQTRACHAEWALADRIFETPATTRDGIRFKLEVLKVFDGCEVSWMDDLLKRDLLRMAGIYDA